MASRTEPHDDPAREERTLRLTRTPRTLTPRWIYLMAGVAALVAAGVAPFHGGPALLPLGLAILLAATAAQGAAPHLVALVARPRVSCVVLRMSEGSERPLLRSTVRGARCVRQLQSSGSQSRAVETFAVVLETRGLPILLGQGLRDREEAEALRADVEALVDAVPADEDEERAEVERARRRLDASKDVEVRTVEDGRAAGYRERARPGLELRLSGGGRLGHGLLTSVAILGIAAMLAGGAALGPDWLLTPVAALGGLATLLSVALAFVRSGARPRIVVHGDHLTIIEGREGASRSERRLALADIGAIDLDVDGRLRIRLHEANEAMQRAIEATAGGSPDAQSLGLIGIGSLARGTYAIPPTRLSYADRAAVALVLGAEVGERAARRA